MIAINNIHWVSSGRLDARVGCRVVLGVEVFQVTGSFKYRAARNVVAHVGADRIVVASSGNFGQALAKACQDAGKRCTIVMPGNSSRSKMAAIQEYGGELDLIDTQKISREDRVRQLIEADPTAYQASAYDDPLVISGNASLGWELAERSQDMDLVVAPIGGGGLTAGIVTGLRESGVSLPVMAAEPEVANDASQSLQAGRIITLADEPDTVADGVRTRRIGDHNWKILKTGLAGILEVPEDAILEATRLLYSLANLKAEPTGALSLACVLTHPERFEGKRVCFVVSGGNVDAERYARIIDGSPSGAPSA